MTFRRLAASLAACLFMAGNACAATILVNGGVHQKTTVAHAPATVGDWSSVLTAFNGDTSHIDVGIAHQITGTATLGQPATGYLYTPEAYPVDLFLYNNSGWNQGTATNVGRTAALAYRTVVAQHGQGDAVAYNGSIFVDMTRSGATDFLANPAGTILNGDTGAGANGVFLNPIYTEINDNGFDVAGMSEVHNLNRTANTGALDAWWTGVRIQSVGTKEIDAAFQALGPMKVFIDETPAGTLDSTTHAFIASVRNARWYGNAGAPAGPDDGYFSSLGTDWLADDSSVGGWLFVAGNVPALQVNSSQVTSDVAFVGKFVGGLDAITSITAGATAQIGTGGTAACAASRRCDSYSGEVTLTTGTGSPATGTLFTVNFNAARGTAPNCIITLQGGAANILLTKTPTTTTLVVGGATALAASTTYTADYMCGGV